MSPDHRTWINDCRLDNANTVHAEPGKQSNLYVWDPLFSECKNAQTKVAF
jgi:hypothetical protein